MDVREKAKKLPASPGVYIMLDSDGTIIYVGKSKALKNRVSSYFQNSKAHSPKVIKMVRNLKDFEYIVTDTEFEALLLECKLIRQIKPVYNRLMKNTKGYCYIKINMTDKYPKIETCNKTDKNSENIYFGPYTSSNTVDRALEGVKENCKILCSTNLSKRHSSCLNYYLGSCIGMCTADDLTEQYSAKSVQFSKENDNLAVMEHLTESTVKFILLKGNNIIFSEKYNLKKDFLDELKKEILFHFNNDELRGEIGIDEIDEMNIIYSYLKNETNNCKYEIISHELLNNDHALYSSVEKLILDINKN